VKVGIPLWDGNYRRSDSSIISCKIDGISTDFVLVFCDGVHEISDPAVKELDFRSGVCLVNIIIIASAFIDN
jgi:hypothetical protein